MVRYACGMRRAERRVQAIKGHSFAVRAVAFNPDGKSVLSGSVDTTLRLWDAETGKELRRYEGHADSIVCAAFSRDGKWALSGSLDGTMRLWRASR